MSLMLRVALFACLVVLGESKTYTYHPENFVEYLDLTDYKDDIVKTHNRLRNQLARQNDRTPYPQIEWDEDLANYAKDSVNQCVKVHSKYFRDQEPNGENIAVVVGNDLTTEYIIEEGIGTWEDEQEKQQDCCNDDWKCFMFWKYDDIPDCTHYSAMIWEKTTTVGCAAAKCVNDDPDDDRPQYYLYCEYYPKGNKIDYYCCEDTDDTKTCSYTPGGPFADHENLPGAWDESLCGPKP